LLHKNAISQAGVGDHFGVLPVPSGIRASGGGGTTGAPKCTWVQPGPFNVQQKHYREPPIASAVGRITP
jgi:hypothetical protein